MTRELLATFFHYSLFLFSLITLGSLWLRWLAWASSKRDFLYFRELSKRLDAELGASDLSFHKESLDKSLVALFKKIGDNLPHRFLKHRSLKKTRPYSETEFIDHDEYIAEHSFFQRIIHEIETFKSPYPHAWPEMAKRVLGQDLYWTKVSGFAPLTISRIIKLTHFMPQGILLLGMVSSVIGLTLAAPFFTSALSPASLPEDQWNFLLKVFSEQFTLCLYPLIFALFCSFLLSGTNALLPPSPYRLRSIQVIGNTLENIWLKINTHHTLEGKVKLSFPMIITELRKLNGNLSKKEDSTQEVPREAS